MFYPVALLFAVYLLPSPAVWLWNASLPLLYGLGYAAHAWLRLDRVYKLTAFALLGGIGWSVLCFGSGWQTALPALWSVLALVRGARAANQDWAVRFSISPMLVGLGMYFVLSVAASFRPELGDHIWLLAGLGLAALTVVLYRFNADAIREQTLSGTRKAELPRAVTWLNRLLVLALLLLAVAITLMSYIQQAFAWLKARLAEWLSRSPGEPEPPPVQPESPEMSPPPMLGEPPGEPAAWMRWLEQAAMIAVYVALGALLLFALYALGKRLPGWMRRLYKTLVAWLNREGRDGESLGYEDQVESLIRTKEPQRSGKRWQDRLADWSRREPRWSEQLTDEEKVRYLYRRWVLEARREGYELKRHLTPLETVADIERWRGGSAVEGLPVTQLYEQVRYGQRSVHAEQLRELEARMRRYMK
ncbi:hypothetical protein PA598K_04332 [Paenibacillus sp. 598K]|nr:hypothetical protein PA598K_04332 [Paenibacillus sp. 598K]